MPPRAPTRRQRRHGPGGCRVCRPRARGLSLSLSLSPFLSLPLSLSPLFSLPLSPSPPPPLSPLFSLHLSPLSLPCLSFSLSVCAPGREEGPPVARHCGSARYAVSRGANASRSVSSRHVPGPSRPTMSPGPTRSSTFPVRHVPPRPRSVTSRHIPVRHVPSHSPVRHVPVHHIRVRPGPHTAPPPTRARTHRPCTALAQRSAGRRAERAGGGGEPT